MEKLCIPVKLLQKKCYLSFGSFRLLVNVSLQLNRHLAPPLALGTCVRRHVKYLFKL